MQDIPWWFLHLGTNQTWLSSAKWLIMLFSEHTSSPQIIIGSQWESKGDKGIQKIMSYVRKMALGHGGGGGEEPFPEYPRVYY